MISTRMTHNGIGIRHGFIQILYKDIRLNPCLIPNIRAVRRCGANIWTQYPIQTSKSKQKLLLKRSFLQTHYLSE